MASFDVLNINRETYSSEFHNNSGQPYDEITLEYVSGVSCKSKSAISANPSNGNIAHVASSVLVLTDPQYHNQAFIENPSAREIASVAFSEDGRFLAFGEYGLNPAVAVFNARVFTQVNIFKVENGKCTVKAIQFHPRAIYMAVLLAYDYGISLYEFIHGTKLASAKWCVEPLAMTMTKMDSTLIVCGHRKISCFSLSNVDSSKYETNAMLEKRAVLLGKQGNYTFVDIASGENQFVKCVYTITSCGYLCDIKSGVIKDVLKVCNKCYCIKFSLGLLLIGCENGTVNICSPDTLSLIASIDDSDLFGRDETHPINWAVKSDILALAINPKTRVVTTLMSNHQTHSWYIKFVDNGFECSPVIVSETATEKKNRNAKLITRHDLNCTLAQLLIQVEMSNRSQKVSKTNFLQRHSPTRFRQFNAIKITPDGTEIIVGNKLGQIKVYEATTGVLKKIIEAHTAEVTFVEVMYDNDFKLVATGGRDRIIFILNVKRDYKLVQAVNDHASAIVSISLAHNNGILTLVSSSKDGVILIRRAPKEDTPKFITIGELPECLGSKTRTYNHSRGYIITGQEKGRINIFPFDQQINLKPVTKIQVGNAFLKSVAIDPTSSFIVAFGTEGQYVFHLQTGQQIATLCYLPGFNHLSFSQDLNYFINSNDAGCKFLWRLPTKIMEVMHANLKDMTSMTVTSREFVFNSYLSCVRVCQHVVGEDEESSSTLKGSKTDSMNINNTDIEELLEEKKIPNERKSMLNKERSQEIMNFLCDDHHMSLVESASCTSCCTTYSRSLTDLVPIMDLMGGDGGVSAVESNHIKADTKKKTNSSLPPNQSPIHTALERTPKFDLHRSKPDTSLTTRSMSAQSPVRNSLGLRKKMESSNIVQGQNEAVEMVPTRDNERAEKQQIRDGISNNHVHNHSKRDSDYDTASDYATTHAQHTSNCEEKTTSFCHDSDTLITTREKFAKIPEHTLITDPIADIKSQSKDIEKMNTTSQFKDSGVAEDQITDCTFIDTQMEDSKSKQSSKSLGSPTVTSNGQGNNDNPPLTKYCSKSNDMSTTLSGMPSGASAAVHLEDDFEALENNLDSLHDLRANEQLHEYYTEFCRNIHLSNSQETYVLKEGGNYDLLNIPLCLDDSGKSSASNTFNHSKSKSIQNSDDIPSSIETRLFGPTCNTSVMGVQSGNSESEQELYNQDIKLKRVFLSWVRRKLNKERRKKKQMRAFGQKQEGSPLLEMSQDVFPPDTLVDDISSTTDTDYITTESNVTFASNTSVCKEVLTSNVKNGDEAVPNTPCKTASEPIAAARFNTLSRSEVGMVQWQRSVHYASTSSVQTKTSTSYSPTYVVSGDSMELPQIGPVYANDVSDDPKALFENSGGKGVVAGGGGGCGSGGGSGAGNSRKADRFRQPIASRLKSPTEKIYSFSESSGSPARKCVQGLEPFMELVPQKSVDSFASIPSIESGGGMASLFRNQDDYLRKLKEVRRNFEKSIQELSNERKNQQIEAQKYFMNQ